MLFSSNYGRLAWALDKHMALDTGPRVEGGEVVAGEGEVSCACCMASEVAHRAAALC